MLTKKRDCNVYLVPVQKPERKEKTEEMKKRRGKTIAAATNTYDPHNNLDISTQTQTIKKRNNNPVYI